MLQKKQKGGNPETEPLSAFESILINRFHPYNEVDKIQNIFDNRFNTVFDNLNNISKIQKFFDYGEFYKVNKLHTRLKLDVYEYNVDTHDDYESMFGSKRANGKDINYIKVFKTEFSIREFEKPANKPISIKHKELTENVFIQKMEDMIQEYYEKYHPLYIFKAIDKYDSIYCVFLHDDHLVLTNFTNSKAFPTSSDYYNNFVIRFELFHATYVKEFDFIKDLELGYQNLRWHKLFDSKILKLRHDAMVSFPFDVPVTAKIFRQAEASMQRENMYSDKDISNIIASFKQHQSPSPPEKLSPAKEPSPKSVASQMTVQQLKQIGKAHSLSRLSKLKKRELITKLVKDIPRETFLQELARFSPSAKLTKKAAK